MSHYAPNAEGLLAPLKPWLDDPEVNEILLNKPQEIYVEKNGKLESHAIKEYHEQRLSMLFQLIANENQQELTEKKPLLSGSLFDGTRVQLVLPPTSKNYTLSIRRNVMQDFTLDHYQKADFYRQARAFDVSDDHLGHLSQEEKALFSSYQKNAWDAFIREAILLRKNIVISGGTSSGKTTFLNACLRHIPMEERLIILEDTREVKTPHQNQVNLLASKGDQGLAKVSMQDLVQCCLRLRPDRIIMGEIRGKEILDFVSACSTGHEGSITSIHANNPRVAFMRMTQMYKLNAVPSMSDEDILRELKEVVDIIVQVAKTPEGRKVQSIYYKYGNLRKNNEGLL